MRNCLFGNTEKVKWHIRIIFYDLGVALLDPVYPSGNRQILRFLGSGGPQSYVAPSKVTWVCIFNSKLS